LIQGFLGNEIRESFTSKEGLANSILFAGYTPTKISTRVDSGNYFSRGDSKMSVSLKKFFVPKLIVLVSTSPCISQMETILGSLKKSC
jgi:hypothetical protein